MPKILVVDDDKKIRELLKAYLEGQGLMVELAENADIAKKILLDQKIDLVTLDVMMPGLNGIELTTQVKSKIDIPIILLTAKSMADERIEGLEAGADDYLVKPFEPKELYLRIMKLIERVNLGSKTPKIVNFGEYEFNIESLRLKKGVERILLSSTEAELLKLFCENINQPIDRAELSRKFNGISERSVDVQITRLRKKIEENPKQPQYLQTSWGTGYVFRI